MVWFKVDDKLHDHRKTRQAGVAAMGLWTLAGSWCSDNLTDGFIPESVLPRWDSGHKKLAQRLITAGLWAAKTVEGEAGYQFHQWIERQPTRADVETERSEAKQRMADMRARKKARSQDVQANVPENVPEKFGRSSESVLSPRPDPTRPVVLSELPTRAGARPSTTDQRIKAGLDVVRRLAEREDQEHDHDHDQQIGAS